MTYFLLVVGGVAGAWSRYYGTRLIQAHFRFPLATLLINVGGSLALGLIYGLIGSQPTLQGQRMLLLLGTGYCGAYTTFSSFAFETLQLWRTHHPAEAIANIVLQPVLGLLGAWVGFWLGTQF